MQFSRLSSIAALALGSIAAAPALAQDCSGFTDVAQGSQFCANIEWVKNRAITTGCGGSTATYCPTQFVTREQMAAFLNRLGTALAPAFQRVRDENIGAQDVTAQKQFCATPQTTITGYPRTAKVRGVMNLYTPTRNPAPLNEGMSVKAWIVYSTDNGTTWLNPATADGYAYGSIYESRTPPDDITLNPYNVIDLNVGTSYRFAVAVQRTAGGATIANVYCENLVELVNRNGASSPFDAPSPAIGGRGD